MAEGVGLTSPVNEIDARLARLEQRAAMSDQPGITVSLDPITGNAVQISPLNYTVGAWESYPKLTTSVTAGVPSGTWNDGDEGLLTPTASRVGNMIFLTGMVRRTFASSGTILANTNQPNVPMFRLPEGWRPARSVLLLCACSTASTVSPEQTAAVGTAMIMVKPDLTKPAGLVKLITTTVNLNAGASGGWVSLCGAFPGVFAALAPLPPPAGSWAAAPPSQTWDQVDPMVTWSTWPNRSGP